MSRRPSPQLWPARRRRRSASALPRARKSILACPDSGCSSTAPTASRCGCRLRKKRKRRSTSSTSSCSRTTRVSCCWARCSMPPPAAYACASCSTMRSASTVATLRPLAAHPNIEIRIFNPFLARHEFAFLRGLEYLLQVGKLDYRMHNKLFVGDNAIAVTGGRSIGDEYFQASGEREFGDFDLAVAGPMVKNLSRTFDLFWNDRLAIPVETQPFGERSTGDLAKARAALAEHRQKMVATSVYYSEISRRSAGRTFCPESVRSSGPRRYSRTTVRTRLPSNRPPDRGALRRHHEPGKQLPGRPGPGKRAGLSRGPMARFGERRLGEPRHGAGREAAEAKLDRDLVAASAGRTAVASALPSHPRQAARRVAWPARSRAAEAHAAPLRRSPRPC